MYIRYHIQPCTLDIISGMLLWGDEEMRCKSGPNGLLAVWDVCLHAECVRPAFSPCRKVSGEPNKQESPVKVLAWGNREQNCAPYGTDMFVFNRLDAFPSNHHRPQHATCWKQNPRDWSRLFLVWLRLPISNRRWHRYISATWSSVQIFTFL